MVCFVSADDERLLYAGAWWTHAAIIGSVSGKCPSHYAAICALRTAKKTMAFWV